MDLIFIYKMDVQHLGYFSIPNTSLVFLYHIINLLFSKRFSGKTKFMLLGMLYKVKRKAFCENHTSPSVFLRLIISDQRAGQVNFYFYM